MAQKYSLRDNPCFTNPLVKGSCNRRTKGCTHQHDIVEDEEWIMVKNDWKGMSAIVHVALEDRSVHLAYMRLTDGEQCFYWPGTFTRIIGVTHYSNIEAKTFPSQDVNEGLMDELEASFTDDDFFECCGEVDLEVEENVSVNEPPFRSGDRVVFNASVHNDLTESEKIQRYIHYGYGLPGVKVFICMCLYERPSTRCALVSVANGELFPFCEVADFRLATEEEIKESKIRF